MLGAVTAALAVGSVAMAQEAAPPTPAAPGAAPAEAPAAVPTRTLLFNAAATSDYVFRGISQTGGGWAPSGGVDFIDGHVYLGNWNSNVDFGPSSGDPGNTTNIEYDLYAGFRPTVGAVALDIGVVRYGYANEPRGANFTYWEGKFLASHAVGRNTLGAAFYYSPQFFGKVGSAEYYEINDAFALTKTLTVSAAVGYQAFDDRARAGIGGYANWEVGGTYAFTPKLGLDLRYWGTDATAASFYGKAYAGDHIAATLKIIFP